MAEILIVSFELLRFLVSVTNRLQQLIVGLLSSQKSLNQFLDIGNSSGCFNLLESLINGLRILHLVVHFLPHEGTPQLLNLKLLAHLSLALVLALIGSSLSNFLVSLLPFDPPPNRLLLVFNASLYLSEDNLCIMVLFLDILHELVNNGLGLNFLLFDTPASALLQLKHFLFIGKRLSCLF